MRSKCAVSFVALALLLGGCICESVKKEAEDLKATAEACQAGDTCVVVSLNELAGANSCLGAFQCSAAINSKVDQAEFSRKAQRLARDFKGCGECVMADCATPSGKAECNAERGRCVQGE